MKIILESYAEFAELAKEFGFVKGAQKVEQIAIPESIKKPAPKPAPKKPVEKPVEVEVEVEFEPETTIVTLDEVVAYYKANLADKVPAVKQLLTKFGVAKLSELTDENRGEFFAEMKEV